MNLKHKTDINAMGQCLLLDKERDILGTLDVGQAVVKLQGRIPRPFQIAIPEFIIEKGKITDSLVKEHMQGIVPAFPKEDFRLPPYTNITNPENSAPGPECESMGKVEVEFLKDVEEYPDSGVAARYKRLGLSVRQGQKVKARLVEKDLIHEEDIRTPKGKVRSISLVGRSDNEMQETS